MTDPFADLERELLAAHARAPRRRPAPRLLAMAAAATALVAAAAWLGAVDDPETAVAPQPQPAASAGACDGSWRPAETDEPVPSGIAAHLAVFREPRPPGTIEIDTRMIGGQATRVYRGSLRSLPRTTGYDAFGIVADIVPRRQTVRPRDPCSPPQGTTEPGACLVLSDAEGAIGACFTLAEIEGGEAYLDVEQARIVGLAPDGPGHARTDEAVSLIEDNLFTLPGGPEARVDFEP